MIYLLMKSEVKKYIRYALLQVPAYSPMTQPGTMLGPGAQEVAKITTINEDNVKPPNKGLLMCGELPQRKT